ncbi:MAG: hybrid sensor histidine kinase/response regulator, partial [Spirochaetia bacterium]|nr:hybrid sensor histidine kinase/response regulator [Spirochaetia bacterium]
TSEIYIQISDTGIGIRKEETEKVWERFYQSDRNQLITATGTGIGLYLVRQLVENCNGKIHFESLELKGTRFHLHLPLVQSDKESVNLPSYEKPIQETQNPNPFIINRSTNSHSNFKILFVEDEPKMKEYITYLLSDFYRIHSVDSVEDAWDEIQKGEYDLILSDWTLPGKNGIYLLNMLRSSEKKIPFLFLTARSEDSYLNEAFQTGADDFILKPFRNEDLLARIQNKIMKSKSQRKEIEEEKDSIYGDIHDMLGGKLADLKIQMDYLFQQETSIPIEKLRGIRTITDSMTFELRNKLHDWEDLRTSQSDFELAFMSMLLRRYSTGARSFKVKLEKDLDWKEANSWNSHKKTNVFRIVQ